MSLYNYVANKDDLLDGIVEIVLGEIELPPGEADWKAAIRQHRDLGPRGPPAPPLGVRASR